MISVINIVDDPRAAPRSLASRAPAELADASGHGNQIAGFWIGRKVGHDIFATGSPQHTFGGLREHRGFGDRLHLCQIYTHPGYSSRPASDSDTGIHGL